VVFREQEGAFLVGVLGAMASKSGTIGYLGGMDIPIIRRIGKGYAEGAHWAVPGIEIIDNVTGTTPAAFVDPARGAELARSQFDRGVDVIFAAAGITGFGALQAAKDEGKLAIGMDSNQNPLFPGTVLTSLLKRVDSAVYDAFMAARAGTWQPGVRSLGLAEGGIHKRFGTIRANDGVDLAVARGTVHGIIGENGAGKSTLMALLYGHFPPDAGEILIHGRAVRLRSPKDAIAAGIGMVHQHFVLVETFSVIENLLLGSEGGPLLHDGARLVREDLARFARDFDLALDPDAIAGSLPVGLRQRLEILK